MLFDKEKFKKYANDIETCAIIFFILYLTIACFIGLIIYKIIGLLIAIGITLFTGYPIYVIIMIKVQEMRWKIDIYEKLQKNE